MQTDHILTLAKRYAAHKGMKISSLGAYAVNDGKFFARLENGGSCTLRTAEKVMVYFRDVWPADLEWPNEVARPAAKRRAA